MNKSLQLSIFWLSSAIMCLAQGALYTSGGMVTDSFGHPIAGVTITVCTSAGTVSGAGQKCTPTATVYSDAALTLPINQTINPILTDGGGGFKFYGQPGSYCYSVTGQNTSSSQCYPIQLPTTSAKIAGSLVVDGSVITSLHQALTMLCSATPQGGMVYLPPGTYAENTTLSVSNGTWCNSVTILGAGSGQCDSVTPPTQITTTLTSGHLFDTTGANDWGIYNVCIKDVAASGAAAAINLSSTQRATGTNIYISGPFAQGLRFFSSSSAASSTIWNNFSNIHCTGLAANGTGVLMDSSNASAKVINGNNILQDHCTGGSGGKALWLTNSGVHNQVINDNVIECTECSASGGTGVQIDQGSTSRLTLVAPNIEGSSLGFVKQTANTVLVINGNISSNGNNSLAANVQDSQPAFTSFLNTSIGGVVQQFAVDPAGGMIVNCVAFPGANCAGLTNLMNGIDGWGFGVAGSEIWAVHSGSLTPFSAALASLGTAPLPVSDVFIGGSANKAVDFNTAALTTNRTKTWQDTAGTVAEINTAQTWSGNQTNIPLVTPTVGGGSTLNLYKVATDSPGAITVNAQTCTARAVAITGVTSGATIQIAANYSMEANIIVSPRRATAGTINYGICNITGANITLDVTASFNLSIWQ